MNFKNIKWIGTFTLLFTFLVTLLFLTGCQGGSYHASSIDENYNTGTDGVILNFLDQAPPQEVFEKSEFDLQVDLSNKGSFSLADGYRGIINVKYEPYYVTPLTANYAGQNLYVNKNNIQLYGKSYYFPKGEENYFALDRFIANPLQGSFEKRKTEFDISLCYPYQTQFVDEICVDTDPQGMSPRKKVCTSKDKSYSGGQGAPIAITAVESNMVPRGVYIQPQFLIHLEHKGDGTFSLLRLEKDAKGNEGCGTVQTDDVGKISIQAQLGVNDLVCKPDIVYFRDNKATVECQLPEKSITGTGANYMTSLAVQLSYLYTQQYSKEITIKRTEGTLFSKDNNVSDDWDCYPWEVYSDNTDGSKTCVNRCSYCANNPSASQCKVTDNEKDPQTGKELSSVKTISPQHSCVYKTTSDCIKAGNDCILQKSFCPTGSYCGLPQCFATGNNALPMISINPRSGDDEVQFYCTDNDDRIDLMRTCGCSRTAKVLFIDTSDTRNCQDIPDSEYQETSEGFYNKAEARMEFTIKLQDFNPNLDLCIQETDKVGAKTYRRVAYPWTR